MDTSFNLKHILESATPDLKKLKTMIKTTIKK